MARLPGLRPLDENPEAPTRRNSGRVQTKTQVSRPQSLRPMASPVDTYSRPEQAPIGSNAWEGLAKALSGVQPSLNHFFEAQVEQKQGGDADANAVNAHLLSLSPEERQKAIREGTVPGLTSLAGREAAAERIAYDTMNGWDEEFTTTFDPAKGNIDQWVAERAKPLLETYGNDPLFRNVFATKIAPYADKLKGKALELRAGVEMEARQGTVMEKWLGKLRFDAGEGKAPADSAAEIFGEFQKNQDYLRLDFKTQQQMVLQAANQLATAGDYDRARALLLHERKDGPYKGSLMTDANVGLQASQVMDRIDTEQKKVGLAQTAAEAETQLKTRLADMFSKGVVRTATPVQIPTASGGSKEVTPEQQAEMAAEDYLSRSDEIAKQLGENREQQFDRELAVLSDNGTEHKTWFSIMNNGFGAASVPNLASNGAMPPQLEEGYEMYKKLYGKNPAYLAQHIDAKAADFYEAVRIAEQDLRQPVDQAMRSAAAELAPGSDDDRKQRQIERDKLKRSVTRTISASSSGGFLGFGSTSPFNEQYVKEEVASYATTLMRTTRVGEDKALELAEKRFKENHITVANTVIKRDPRMPPNFADGVNAHIAEFIKQHGEELEADVDDIALYATDTQGTWRLYNKTLDRFIPTKFDGWQITFRSIADAQRTQRETAEQEVIKTHKNNR